MVWCVVDLDVRGIATVPILTSLSLGLAFVHSPFGHLGDRSSQVMSESVGDGRGWGGRDRRWSVRVTQVTAAFGALGA